MFKTVSKHGVVYLISDKIPAPHGFSTRLGGKSTDTALMSMNFGSSCPDSHVIENIDIFTSAVNLPPKTVRAKQIHSCDIECFFTPESIENIDNNGFLNRSCDGFITNQKGLSLCVRTADCLPVIMSDRSGSIVCAVHAGWRGSVAGIVREAVSIFKEQGICEKDIFAALGPCISHCCFEVGEDFIENFKSSPASNFFDDVIEKRNDSYFCDLKKLNRILLTECGLPDSNIDVCEYCTHHNPDMFFSHRLTGNNRGTMGSVVAIG